MLLSQQINQRVPSPDVAVLDQKALMDRKFDDCREMSELIPTMIPFLAFFSSLNSQALSRTTVG
jgi:hypothetical protein